MGAFLRWFHNGGRRTYAPTRAVAAELRGRGFRDLAVWGRGVDDERFHPARRDPALRARWGAGPGDLVALTVGRLAREKGVPLALVAARDASARLAGGDASGERPGTSSGIALGARFGESLGDSPVRPRLVPVVVGDGPDEAACRAAAPPGAVFAGRLTGAALAAAYASADVFVFPSQTDTFGNVLLEAVASGLPVLAAEAASTAELLGWDGPAPRGVPAPATANALGAALAALARDPARRRALGARGRAFAEAQSWGRVFDALFADYRAVAARV